MPITEEVWMPAGRVLLPGELVLPPHNRGVIVFAHGSGSSRHSSRNRHVARRLNAAGFGTLLFDLLTEAEESDRNNVFDIGLLASRLNSVAEWLRAHPVTANSPIGYFGASTGAAAALLAAATGTHQPFAVVSRGGRPDLAGRLLARVKAPTLLIVGSRDLEVIELNKQAASLLPCEHNITIIPGATHLFEEAGALDSVAAAAGMWFSHFVPIRQTSLLA